MNHVIKYNGLPIKVWTDNVEELAISQALNLANLPFAFKHIALMPDVHSGYGMPIGGVLATKDVIIPNAVGVDIGCGMSFVKSNFTNHNKDGLLKVKKIIKNLIPVGKKHRKEPISINLLYKFNKFLYDDVVLKELDSIPYQIGTLGSGNHFLEIQENENGELCLMVHSGSRNLGFKIANHYHKLAKENLEKYYSIVPSDLAFIYIKSDLGKRYIESMNIALDFALESRRIMLNSMIFAVKEVFGDVLFDSNIIDIHHNYARMENHFGSNVMVHRKGAVFAGINHIGIIPGSQGSFSYITRGLGNKLSFCSCSHGAGRKMSRNDAVKNLNFEDEIKKLNDIGVLHDVNSERKLDESIGSYKDIDEVMENQKDLVEIVSKLKPLAVIKG